MKEKKPNIYVPGKNRRHRKHYWWRYLLVFILGQALVLPEFLLTLGTASTAVDLNTIMSIIPGVKADDYLTEKSKKMTVLDLAMYFASPSFKPQCLDDINDIVKLNSIITNVSSKNEKAEKIVGAVITDDFMKTGFKDLGKYFTDKVEIAPVLAAAGVQLPSIAETFLYKTPVAYFGKTTTESIKMVKGDSLDLAGSKVQVLPAAASKAGFSLTLQDNSTANVTGDKTTVTVATNSPNGTAVFTAKADDTSVTNELELTIEVVDSVTLGAPAKSYFDEEEQIFVWDNVDFAKEYLVTLPDGATTKTIKGNTLSAADLSLTDGSEVTLKVKALSPDANHLEGAETTLSFTYKAKPAEGGGEEGEDRKFIKSADDKTPEETETTSTHVDVYDKQNGEEHPNGYDDETGELIRTANTFKDVTAAFSGGFDITSLIGNATVGDLMGMFSGGGLSANTTEPTRPDIKINKEIEDIMDVFKTIPVSSLIGGGANIMDVLKPCKLSLILKDKEDDPLLGDLVNMTFDDLMNNSDLMNTVIGDKKLGDLVPSLKDEGQPHLIKLIADTCLVRKTGSTDPDAPQLATDLFTTLTIGEALNVGEDNTNAILDCLKDIKLSSSNVGTEMSDALKTKTVGELLDMEKGSGNAILDTLIDCKLDSTSLQTAMDDMKIETVIGAGNMYEYDDANNPIKVKGIWAMMFNNVADAQAAKVTNMGDLMTSMATNMMSKTLYELQAAGIVSPNTDLTKQVVGGSNTIGDLTIQGLIDVVANLGQA